MKKYKIPTKLTKPKPVKPQEQKDLEIISAFLRPSTAVVDSILEAINFHSIAAPCEWGYQPILRYTPEALTTYATRLYKHIQQDLGGIAISEVDYVAQWLAPEAKIKAWFDSKEAGFISALETIVAKPMQFPEHIIDDSGLGTQLSDFLKGNREDFRDLSSFLCYSHSPLRAHLKDFSSTLIDSRIATLLAEVDKMRAKCNKALDGFICDELERCRVLCKDRLAYYKLKPDDITLITVRKDLIPVEDWEIISQALESKVVSKDVKNLIMEHIKSIKKAPPAAVTQDKSAELAHSVDINEAFIRNFIPQLGEEYVKLKTKTDAEAAAAATEGFKSVGLDGILGLIAATYLARETGTSFETLQSQQVASEAWYFDFVNIHQPLMACLQIALNSISPSVLLAPEVLSHKAIQGMLAFADYVKTKRNTYIDYEKSAMKLLHQLKHHTSAFLDLPPLPELVPVSKEVLLGAMAGTVQQAKVTDLSFNLTKFIQLKLNTLKPTTAFTQYKEVSLTDVKIQALVPVPDPTITQLLVLVAGKGCKPYLLNGDLIARTADGLYLEIVPDINNNKGYASYIFTPVNYKALNWLIERYCELLQDVPAYDTLLGYHIIGEDEEFFGITPEYDYTLTEADAEAIQAFASVDIDDVPTIDAEIADVYFDDSSLSTINALLKARMQSTREHFGLSVLSDKLDSQARLYAEDCKLLKYLQTVVERVYDALEQPYKRPYAKYIDDEPCYISGHYLSKWVSDPVKYTEKITNGGGKYSVDHEKQGVEYRSDNSFDNLSIVLKGYNSGRTSRSTSVNYNGHNYVSLSTYCTETDAGNVDNIEALKNSLQLGETKEYKRRVYTKVTLKQLIAVDVETAPVPPVTFNGEPYDSLAAFAKMYKLNHAVLRNLKSAAKKEGKSEFSHKKYKIYWDADDNITITL